jgi:TIR domain
MPPCGYQHDFFISYPHPKVEGKNIVTEFVDELVKQIKFLYTENPLPKPVFYDLELEPGFRWKPALLKSLCHSRCMLVIYTGDYFTREYCVREWDAMMDLEVRRLGSRTIRSMTIPILLRAEEDDFQRPILPAALQGLECLDFRKVWSPRRELQGSKAREKLGLLLKCIKDLKRLSPEPAVDCNTYQGLVSTPVEPARLESFGGSWS